MYIYKNDIYEQVFLKVIRLVSKLFLFCVFFISIFVCIGLYFGYYYVLNEEVGSCIHMQCKPTISWLLHTRF